VSLGRREPAERPRRARRLLLRARSFAAGLASEQGGQYQMLHTSRMGNDPMLSAAEAHARSPRSAVRRRARRPLFRTGIVGDGDVETVLRAVLSLSNEKHRNPVDVAFGAAHASSDG